MFGVEGILDLDGDVLNADGVDGRRVDYLGAEVTQLHGLDIRQLVNGVCRFDNTRVSCHEAVDVCPYLQYLCIEGCGNDGCCIVAAATSQIGGFAGVAVAADKAWHDGNGMVCATIATDGSEGFFYHAGG